MTNFSDHHRDLMVQIPYYDVIPVYNYDEDRVEASSANDTAIELDVCNLDNLIKRIAKEKQKKTSSTYNKVRLIDIQHPNPH